MVQAAHSSPTPATNGDHPSAPSRLLSKHRPRRRAAAPRPNLPPPASTRGQPDLNTCHCCDVRFPAPAPGAKRRPVRPLRSVWRIVFLCTECLSLVRSAAICSYCLSLDDIPSEGSSVTCRSCSCCVHPYCILAEHRTALIQPIDVENFVCVDCCPIVKPRSNNNGGATSVPKLDASVWETDSTAKRKGDAAMVAKLDFLRERHSGQVKPTSNCAKEVIVLMDGDGGSEMIGTSDPDMADKELALQLHLAMNGSQRISRSGCGGSAGQGKGQKGMLSGTKVNGDHGLCVTNMMDQLDDDETEADMMSNWSANYVERLDPSVTVVLALECPDKHAQGSMWGRRRSLHETKHYGLVDRFKKKYSKRNSSGQVDVGSTKSKTMLDGHDDGTMT